jgi:hypothetical protein
MHHTDLPAVRIFNGCVETAFLCNSACRRREKNGRVSFCVKICTRTFNCRHWQQRELLATPQALLQRPPAYSCGSRHFGTAFAYAYIGPPYGPMQRPNPVRYVQCGCYEATARSETRKLARVRCATCCDPRAAPPGEYGLKSGKNGNGHLARANGAIDGPYFSPTWPSVFGRRCEPLAGRGGGFGGVELHQRPHWGASSIRVPQ